MHYRQHQVRHLISPSAVFTRRSAGIPHSPLSASTPTIDVAPDSYRNTRSHSSLFKSLFSILPTIGPLNRKHSDKSEGLIAPRSPMHPPSIPPSPAIGRPFSNTVLNTANIPPPLSPRTPGGGLEPGSFATQLLSPGLGDLGSDFRLGVPPPRRVSSRVTSADVGDSMTRPVRRATADSVGRAGSSASRGREVGYD
jgi:hypothetical protein